MSKFVGKTSIVILIIVALCGSTFVGGWYAASVMVPPPTTISTTGTANVGGLVSSGWANATNTKFTNDFFWGATNRTDTIAYPEETASYVVWKDGATYYAKNGHTGQIDYSGSDASTVINAAITALATAGGKIFIKSGLYTITASINLVNKDNIFIQGEGADYLALKGTIFKANGLAENMLNIEGTTVYGHINNIIIEDLTMSGYGQTAGDLINIKNAREVTLKNIQLINGFRCNIYADDWEESYTENIQASGTQTSNSIWLVSTEGVVFIRPKIGAAVLTGLELDTCIAVDVYGCDIFECTGNGIRIYAASKLCRVIGGNVHTNQLEGINIDSDCIHNTLLGVGVYDNAQDGAPRAGIRIQNSAGGGCFDNLVEGCQVWDGQTIKTQNYALVEQDNSDYNLIACNDFRGNEVGSIQGIVGVHTKVHNNLGFVTENSGTFSIALHSKTATVTHGLAYTPTASDIGITWTSSLTNCTSWSVTGIGAAQFTVNLYDANGDAKGPSGTVTGSWKSIKTP